jgi:hypothetical protein
MLKQHLRPEIEKVRWFVKQQQVGLMKEQGSQLDPGLPTTRKCLNRPMQGATLQLKLTGYLATFPVWLVTVPHQEIKRRLIRQKGIVLPQISKPKPWMVDDLPAV